MLLLYETAAGFALFKVLDESKVNAEEAQDLWQDFESLEKAQKVVKLKAFSKFENTTEALAAATALVDSKLSKGLKKFLKKHAGTEEVLTVMDSKLGNLIKEKLGIPCVFNQQVMELARGIRQQLVGLVSGLTDQTLTPMSLGLSHSLSRYKLKFSPDKSHSGAVHQVDTMIVQAIGLLDDLDKELNTYAMRVKEWYGWHFPEMAKIVADNLAYARVIKLMGTRTNAEATEFSGILEEEVESVLKEAAVVSMGTEISTEDLDSIKDLCDQVIALSEYRAELYDYLKSRMMAIAPNLTILVGELVGARLIAHAGSLMQLAKVPASTIQILGAEKALFRALKTKHDTPKYGLIYHASLVGQAPQKYKGKVSRSLAAKCALGIRVDALGDDADGAENIGLEARAKVEAQLRQLEGKAAGIEAAAVRGKPQPGKYDKQRQAEQSALLTQPKAFSAAADVTTNVEAAAEKSEKKKKKRKVEEAAAPAVEAAAAGAPADEEAPKKKKKKKDQADDANGVMNGGADVDAAKPKKKKKTKDADAAADGAEAKPKKAKKQKTAAGE